MWPCTPATAAQSTTAASPEISRHQTATSKPPGNPQTAAALFKTGARSPTAQVSTTSAAASTPPNGPAPPYQSGSSPPTPCQPISHQEIPTPQPGARPQHGLPATAISTRNSMICRSSLISPSVETGRARFGARRVVPVARGRVSTTCRITPRLSKRVIGVFGLLRFIRMGLVLWVVLRVRTWVLGMRSVLVGIPRRGMDSLLGLR